MRPHFLNVFLACILLLGLSSLGHAHVHLDKSTPNQDEILETPPTAVKLWFSGKVESAWSKIEVKDAHGNRVDQGDVININNDPKTLVIPLNAISAGKYNVNWNVVASDGHRIKGGLSFTVK